MVMKIIKRISTMMLVVGCMTGFYGNAANQGLVEGASGQELSDLANQIKDAYVVSQQESAKRMPEIRRKQMATYMAKVRGMGMDQSIWQWLIPVALGLVLLSLLGGFLYKRKKQKICGPDGCCDQEVCKARGHAKHGKHKSHENEFEVEYEIKYEKNEKRGL